MIAPSDLTFSQTYLHKIHILTTDLDRAFNKILHIHAGVSLSQFMLLVTVLEHTAVNQRTVAHFLRISPAAIKRQVDIAINANLLRIEITGKVPGQTLQLTQAGHTLIKTSMHALELHLFDIFAAANHQAGLMTHIDVLLDNTKGVLNKQAALYETNKRKD